MTSAKNRDFLDFGRAMFWPPRMISFLDASVIVGSRSDRISRDRRCDTSLFGNAAAVSTGLLW